MDLRSAFRYVQVINAARSASWHNDGVPWTIADWTNATAGEAGELANVAKKIRRIDTGAIHRDQETDRAALVAKAKAEIADVVIYAMLTLDHLDKEANLYDVIAAKFNETSEKFGFPHRLPTDNLDMSCESRVKFLLEHYHLYGDDGVFCFPDGEMWYRNEQ